MKKRLSCRTIVRHVCERLDERLDSEECRAIRRHLEDCPNCASYLDSLKKTILLYKAYPSPLLPVRCRKRLTEALALEPRPRRTRS